MLQLAPGNVPTVVHILELDSPDLLVDLVSRHPESVLAAHYRHHPASICDEMLAVTQGAGVKNERFWVQLVQAIDSESCFIRLGVPTGCQHNANRVATLAQRAGVPHPGLLLRPQITARTDRLTPWEAQPGIPDLRTGS